MEQIQNLMEFYVILYRQSMTYFFKLDLCSALLLVELFINIMDTNSQWTSGWFHFLL